MEGSDDGQPAGSIRGAGNASVLAYLRKKKSVGNSLILPTKGAAGAFPGAAARPFPSVEAGAVPPIPVP